MAEAGRTVSNPQWIDVPGKSERPVGLQERMLTMAQVQNIRFMRKFKGLSLRAIAEETGHYFETG